MSEKQYLTAPVATTTMPKGIPHIVGNEAAERFSYYGMRAILVIFLTGHLQNALGQPDFMSDAEAKVWYHKFLAAAYFFPVLGALISDLWLGKYRTIIWLSVLYCVGHLVLAVFETRTGVFWGLSLIALGAGGIKPCVSAHVGDQFGRSNQNLLTKVFAWFYFSINLGAFVSTLLTPYLLSRYGSHWAFGVPGILMLLATVVFWMGRKVFVHIPADPVGFRKDLFGGLGLRPMLKLVLMYLFIVVFWSVYDQNGSDWVIQARQMDRHFFGVELDPAQIQSANPILVLIYIPLFSYVIYPMLGKVFPVRASMKIGCGLFLLVPVILIIVYVQKMIDAGQTPSILWHILAFSVLTASEVMIYQTGLEYTYTQSPKSIKSFMMSLYLLTVSLGNFLTSEVNQFNQNKDGTVKMAGVEYNVFFLKIVVVATVIYWMVAASGVFKEKSILQDEHIPEPDQPLQ